MESIDNKIGQEMNIQTNDPSRKDSQRESDDDRSSGPKQQQGEDEDRKLPSREVIVDFVMTTQAASIAPLHAPLHKEGDTPPSVASSYAESSSESNQIQQTTICVRGRSSTGLQGQPRSNQAACQSASESARLQTKFSDVAIRPLSSTSEALPATKILQGSSMLTRGQVMQQVYFLAAVAAVSLITVVVVILPAPALLASVVLMAVVCRMMYTVLQFALQQWQQTMAGRGLGDYMPQTLYDTLTQQTLHDFLLDDSFGLDHRYLLLYVLPLTNQQRELLTARLAPHHQEALRRPGVGHMFLGPTVMRMIMGDQRLASQQQHQRAMSNQVYNSSSNDPNQHDHYDAVGDFNDDHHEDDASEETRSSSGLDLTPDDMAGGLSDAQASAMAHAIGLSTATNAEPSADPVTAVTNTPSSMSGAPRGTGMSTATMTTMPTSAELELYYAQETEVLAEAIQDSIASYTTPIYVTIMTTVSSYLQPLSQRLMWSSLSVTAISTSLATFQWWTQRSRSQIVRPRSHSFIPSQETLWMTSILGIASAGMAYSVRSYLRSAMVAIAETQQQGKETQGSKSKHSGGTEEKQKASPS